MGVLADTMEEHVKVVQGVRKQRDLTKITNNGYHRNNFTTTSNEQRGWGCEHKRGFSGPAKLQRYDGYDVDVDVGVGVGVGDGDGD
eukprot:1478661-Lingulodinium_polyedra.AAC.1